MVLICLILFWLELSTGVIDASFQDLISALSGNLTENSSLQHIILEIRLPRSMTAFWGGMALSVAGLLLQTLFRNPLAGPSVLGISSGAILGVSLVVLAAGGSLTGWLAGTAVTGGAMAGALAVTLVLLFVAGRLRDNTSLLIFGLMLGYLVSAVISVLEVNSGEQALKAFVIWGMGSFSRTSLMDANILALATLASASLLMFFLSQMNGLLLGDANAFSMGISVRRIRLLIILVSSILTALVSAYCGPVAFIGLVIPHLARLCLASSDHRKVLPLSMLMGAAAGLLCDWLSHSIFGGQLPLNTVTSALGAPVVLYLIIRGNQSRILI
jgi:iron complex transport system permease protein